MFSIYSFLCALDAAAVPDWSWLRWQPVHRRQQSIQRWSTRVSATADWWLWAGRTRPCWVTMTQLTDLNPIWAMHTTQQWLVNVVIASVTRAASVPAFLWRMQVVSWNLVPWTVSGQHKPQMGTSDVFRNLTKGRRGHKIKNSKIIDTGIVKNRWDVWQNVWHVGYTCANRLRIGQPGLIAPLPAALALWPWDKVMTDDNSVWVDGVV